jgi:hypothetical protein
MLQQVATGVQQVVRGAQQFVAGRQQFVGRQHCTRWQHEFLCRAWARLPEKANSMTANTTAANFLMA